MILITFDIHVRRSLVRSTVTFIFALIALAHFLQEQRPVRSLGLHDHHLGGDDFLLVVIPDDGDVLAQFAVQRHLVFLGGGVVLQLHDEDGFALWRGTTFRSLFRCSVFYNAKPLGANCSVATMAGS